MINFSLIPFKPVANYKINGQIARTFNQLWLTIEIEGDLDQIFLPPTKGAPRREEKLWETTCFELFMGEEGNPHYFEFNISPAGDWNVFEFTQYRKGPEPVKDIFSPSIDRQIVNPHHIKYAIGIPLFNEVKFLKKIGISAVIKTLSGQLQYFALTHPREVADFHDPRSFTLDLPHQP
ncbi:MAG: DOMON-like domain-containing protein [Bdellovibrionales bacterium]|jgi:hypothetical protein|nr:DOMON-like domain-containing protein [Bdellovibrionales bacterium]